MRYESMSNGELISCLKRRITLYKRFGWLGELFCIAVIAGTVYFAWSDWNNDFVPVSCAFASIIIADREMFKDRHQLNKKILTILAQQSSRP